jgi:hypothetical protein
VTGAAACQAVGGGFGCTGVAAELLPLTAVFPKLEQREAVMGRGILLWLLGVPLPIIIILALLWH